MDDQATTLQLDLIDNGLSSHNGNNIDAMEITDSLQSQKMIEHSPDVDGSNGIKSVDKSSLDTATSTTTDSATNDITKKVPSSSNGVEQKVSTVESVDNHQDDDLIRELEQFEGSKKDDEVTLPQSSTNAENGTKLQDTSDLLKDLESDSPCPNESEMETSIGNADAMQIDPIKKTDDGHQVDSTTNQSSNKRKFSSDGFVENVPKRANIDATAEKSNAPDVLSTDTQKSTSEIDSDTESKLLQENSDGEASMSDVVDITSTSTLTATSKDVKPITENAPSNEDVVVSSSGNVEPVVNAESINDPKAALSKNGVETNANVTENSASPKADDFVSSNKLNDTTDITEQDFDVTVEADRINGQNTSVTSNDTFAQNQVELPALGKTSETVVSSQAEPVESSASKTSTKQIDHLVVVPEKHNGLSSDPSESKQKESSHSDPIEPTEVKPIPVERTFDICVSYEDNELKSMTVNRSVKETGEQSVELSSEQTNHTAKGVVELCNFMIDHFSAIKKSLNVDDASTPPKVQRGRGSAKKSTTLSQSTPKATSGKRGSASKRSLDKTDIEESESKSKKAHNSNDEAVEVKGDCCLAKWTDRKYYAGRVIEEKPGNKFSVLFEDGAMKTLPAEVVVFGTGNILPLLDHAVHVLVADDTYEPGFVTKVDSEGDVVMYTVAAESKTVTCSSSSLYLMDDQAKAIHNSIKSNEVLMKTPDTPSSKRTGRLPAKLEETITMGSGGRSSRGKKGQVSSPEPGFSGDIDTKKSGRRSTKRPPPPSPVVRLSESSDLSDPIEEFPRLNSDTALEAINGVQPELQCTPKDSEIYKRNLIAEYLDNDPTRSLDGLLGPMPTKNDLFRGYHFILTCTIPPKQSRMTETNGHQFGSLPFYKDHLCSQIEAGGGTVYRFFEQIPKARYRNCKLIAQRPCTTAKYVQCVAANIMPVSYDWIIDCCTKNQLLNCDEFILPSGWSLLNEVYIDWKVTRSKRSRKSTKPLKNVHVLIASLHEDFTSFWQRVCKLAGSIVSIVDSLDDIDDKTNGFMLTDEDFSDEIKLKAEYYNIPVVSTVWVVQSLIAGGHVDPESNRKLKMAYEDEDY